MDAIKPIMRIVDNKNSKIITVPVVISTLYFWLSSSIQSVNIFGYTLAAVYFVKCLICIREELKNGNSARDEGILVKFDAFETGYKIGILQIMALIALFISIKLAVKFENSVLSMIFLYTCLGGNFLIVIIDMSLTFANYFKFKKTR